MPIKDVRVALGHADLRTTLDIHPKAVPRWESSAGARVDAYFEGDPGANVLRKSDAGEAG